MGGQEYGARLNQQQPLLDCTHRPKQLILKQKTLLPSKQQLQQTDPVPLTHAPAVTAGTMRCSKESPSVLRVRAMAQLLSKEPMRLLSITTPGSSILPDISG
jgi:hypothetical protein